MCMLPNKLKFNVIHEETKYPFGSYLTSGSIKSDKLQIYKTKFKGELITYGFNGKVYVIRTQELSYELIQALFIWYEEYQHIPPHIYIGITLQTSLPVYEYDDRVIHEVRGSFFNYFHVPINEKRKIKHGLKNRPKKRKKK